MLWKNIDGARNLIYVTDKNPTCCSSFCNYVQITSLYLVHRCNPLHKLWEYMVNTFPSTHQVTLLLPSFFILGNCLVIEKPSNCKRWSQESSFCTIPDLLHLHNCMRWGLAPSGGAYCNNHLDHQLKSRRLVDHWIHGWPLLPLESQYRWSGVTNVVVQDRARMY